VTGQRRMAMVWGSRVIGRELDDMNASIGYHPAEGQLVYIQTGLKHVSFSLLAALLLAGCEQSSVHHEWIGPKMLSVVTEDDQVSATIKTHVLHTPHYEIYTTIDDRPDLIARTAQLMEGGFDAYRTLAPNVQPTNYPMKCFLFANNVQWRDFTRQHTGPDSDIYLKITRGGYTIHDWYVAYYIGDITTYSVAAHEGWHQFVNRHFKGRLPPFLEEGLACMFENVEWNNDLPRWNLSMNPARTLSLRRAMDAGELFTLDQLVTLHAGMVVNQSNIRIEAFYAQCWAFARFMWEGENGKYRPALQKLFQDTADGSVADPTGSLRNSYHSWNPAGVKPMLEHYLGQDLTETSKEFTDFEKKIAYQEMSSQFEL